MRPSLKATAIGLCWVVAVAVVAFTTAHGQKEARDALDARFSDRASTSAASVAAYVRDVFERQTRMAVSLPGRVSDDDLNRERVAAGFATSVLLDSEGKVLASSPPGPTVHGDDLSGLDPHIFEALSGERAVSGVVASAVGPIVEFALPLEEDGSRVLASGFVLADSPLSTFLSVPPIAGARGYIVDELGHALVFAGAGATAAMEGTASQRAQAEPLIVDGRVLVSTPVEGTPWGLVLTAPQSAVVAPATADDWVEWSVIVVAAGLILCALLVLRSVSKARQRSQAAQMEAEQRFRLTVDNAPIGMLLVALDGRILRANSRFCTMLCYQSEQLLQMTIRDITHPDDLAEVSTLLRELAPGESSYYEGEKRYVRGDGAVVWVRLSVSVVRDARGKPLHFVSQSEDITAVRAAQEQLEQRALYDGLTGLANRGLLIDRLTHALADHRRNDALLAVAFCDLDHFKRVNDSLGHHAGDLVLQEVARRLQEVVRDSDTVARVGGDEFVILLPRVSSIETATAILDRAKAALDEPIDIEGDSVSMSLSSGVAIAEATCTADEVMRNADRALYAAKEGGRGRWKVYTAAMRSTALVHLSAERELRRALEMDELVLHYQPIVRLSDRRTVAFEALVRWQHPTRGLLMPASFIDVAEESHLMVELGRLVLRHACQFLSRHPDAAWRVFVNVSPAQLGRGLDGVVRSELAASGVSAARLGVELTENAVLVAHGSSLAEMQSLRAMGIELLMDDFGTGYSALSSVLTTPITGIKLDMSFTSRLGIDEPADRISATVAGLVEDLGAHGVVEGIETDDQCRRVMRHGWVHGQGYLFARPAPEHELRLPDRDAVLL